MSRGCFFITSLCSSTLYRISYYCGGFTTNNTSHTIKKIAWHELFSPHIINFNNLSDGNVAPLFFCEWMNDVKVEYNLQIVSALARHTISIHNSPTGMILKKIIIIERWPSPYYYHYLCCVDYEPTQNRKPYDPLMVVLYEHRDLVGNPYPKMKPMLEP